MLLGGKGIAECTFPAGQERQGYAMLCISVLGFIVWPQHEHVLAMEGRAHFLLQIEVDGGWCLGEGYKISSEAVIAMLRGSSLHS